MTKREAISIGISRLMHGDSVNDVGDYLSLEFELYAKQQAIAFADHLQFNYQPHPEAGFWHDHHSDQKGYVKLTSQRLYNQFIEQQQNK